MKTVRWFEKNFGMRCPEHHKIGASTISNRRSDVDYWQVARYVSETDDTVTVEVEYLSAWADHRARKQTLTLAKEAS